MTGFKVLYWNFFPPEWFFTCFCVQQTSHLRYFCITQVRVTGTSNQGLALVLSICTASWKQQYFLTALLFEVLFSVFLPSLFPFFPSFPSTLPQSPPLLIFNHASLPSFSPFSLPFLSYFSSSCIPSFPSLSLPTEMFCLLGPSLPWWPHTIVSIWGGLCLLCPVPTLLRSVKFRYTGLNRNLQTNTAGFSSQIPTKFTDSTLFLAPTFCSLSLPA